MGASASTSSSHTTSPKRAPRTMAAKGTSRAVINSTKETTTTTKTRTNPHSNSTTNLKDTNPSSSSNSSRIRTGGNPCSNNNSSSSTTRRAATDSKLTMAATSPPSGHHAVSSTGRGADSDSVPPPISLENEQIKDSSSLQQRADGQAISPCRVVATLRLNNKLLISLLIGVGLYTLKRPEKAQETTAQYTKCSTTYSTFLI